jgi:hypothetical protein
VGVQLFTGLFGLQRRGEPVIDAGPEPQPVRLRRRGVQDER